VYVCIAQTRELLLDNGLVHKILSLMRDEEVANVCSDIILSLEGHLTLE
jgi:predicted nucleic acid-binding protein